MAVYSIEGKLGTGKSKFAVFMMQQALRQGRAVATNLDLNLAELVPERRASYIRLPDKPTANDLELCGHGNPDSYDEDKNGLMVLDECGTWLNARTFQDKARAGVIDWLIHARKHGWDVMFIVQGAGMIDKQIREDLIEYDCRCLRLDKVRIPFIGAMLNGVFGGRVGYFPRMHMVTARVGVKGSQIIAQRWMFRGDDLHKAYDTRQVFRPDYPHGTYWSLPTIPPVKPPGLVARLVEWSRGPARPALKPKLPMVEILMQMPPDRRVAVARAMYRPELISRAQLIRQQ